MKVRYYSCTQPIARDISAKNLVNQIKTNGTVAMSLPNGDVPVNYLFFILGGRESIGQFLRSSTGEKFYAADQLRAKYLRINMGIGKHYTLIAVGSGHAFVGLGRGLAWNDMNIVDRGSFGSVGGHMQRPLYTLSYSAIATALTQAESKITSGIIEYAGI